MSLSERSWRRRQQELDDDERRRLERGELGRPNIPPRADPIYDYCNDSKFGTHRFVGARRVCEFCLRPEAACRRG